MLPAPDQRFIKSDGIILRRSDYSETSLVLSILTREHGTVSVLAKGAHRPKHIFEGEIDLLARGQAVILISPRSTLHILTEFSCRERYLGLRQSPERMTAAQYAAQIAGDASPEGEGQPEIYDLLAHTLNHLERAEIAPALAYFQVHLLRLSGYMPNLHECAACGAQIDDVTATYSYTQMGLTCPKCKREDDRTAEVLRGTISLIGSLARKTPRAPARMRIPAALARETITFLAHVIAADFEREHRTLQPLLAMLGKKTGPGGRSK